MADDTPEPACCKVGRGIAKYDCGGLNDRLVRAYTEEGASLRDLEEVINEAYVAGAIDASPSAIDLTPERVVSVLRGDGDTEPRARARLRTRLEQQGVDIEALEGDFVTYRTVKTHLNECLDVDTSRQESLTIDDARDTIGWSQARCEGVIETTVERLANADRATIGDSFDVTVSPRIECRDCGSSLTPTQFLERGGCECADRE